MDYCDFPIGKYRASVTTHYLNELKEQGHIRSNYFYFESTQPVEEILIQSAGIDVCHQYYKDKSNNKIWIAYVGEEDGIIRIKYSKDEYPYRWQTYPFPVTFADKCGLCFNSSLQKGSGEDIGIYEFITDEYPFLYYVRDGALYICNLANNVTITAAAENVIDASMIRGPIGLDGSYDLGLIVFFIAGNDVFYKQYIRGVWYDAEVVSLFANNSEFTAIKAFRTWDFRVGLLLKNIDNELYQYITFVEGLSELINEHIEVSVAATASLTGISYSYFKNADEHIEVSVDATAGIIYGLSAIPISTTNVEDSNGNWGTTIEITMDYPCTHAVANEFILNDSNGITYSCETAVCDGNVIRLTFVDFNLASLAANVTVTYTKGTLLSPATSTNSFTVTFVPINLETPSVPAPEFSSAKNRKDEITIDVKLTQRRVYAVLKDMASHFGLAMQEYSYVPGGSLVNKTRSINSVTAYEGLYLNLDEGSMSHTTYDSDNKVIKLEVHANE